MKMEDTKTKVIEGTVFDSKFNAHSRRICLYEHPSLDPISRKATLVIGERGIPESEVKEQMSAMFTKLAQRWPTWTAQHRSVVAFMDENGIELKKPV